MSALKITPNQLTIIRIVLAFLSFYFLLQHTLSDRIIAFTIFTIAGLTDLWDGWLARRGGMITNFGKILDPIADKILVLGAFTILSMLGCYVWWMLVPIFLREISVTVIRLWFLKKDIVVQAERSGKIKVITQFISLSVTFLYLLSKEYGAGILGVQWNPGIEQILLIGNLLFLGIATWFTLLSGWEFFKHNWRHIYE